jgi:hypothetical protein
MSRRASTNTTAQRLRAAFLAELRRRGNVSDAARAATIDRTTAYLWRKNEPEFAAAWDEAIEAAIDSLEAEAWRRAAEGVEEPVIGRVGKDKDGIVRDADGLPLFVRKYSDSLMNTLLKAHRPEKYRERQDVQHSGGVTVRVVYDDDDTNA